MSIDIRSKVSIGKPAASSSSSSSRSAAYCNRWFTDNDATIDWSFTDHDRTATQQRTTAPPRAIRTFAGYRRGRYTIDFTSLTGKFQHATLGLVPASYRFDEQHKYSLMNSKTYQKPSGGVHLNCDTGELVSRLALAKPYVGRCADIFIRVRFALDFNAVPVMLQLWYDDDQKGSWSFDELGLPSNETIYPVYWGKGDITIDAPLDDQLVYTSPKDVTSATAGATAPIVPTPPLHVTPASVPVVQVATTPSLLLHEIKNGTGTSSIQFICLFFGF